MDIMLSSKRLENVVLLPPKYALKPLRYQLQENTRIYNGRGDILAKIPSGFISDGASVPTQLQRFFPPMGMYVVAALAHDHLCDVANHTGEYRTRKWADENFHSWLRECGVSQLRAKPMSAAVIAWGKWLKFTGKLS